MCLPSSRIVKRRSVCGTNPAGCLRKPHLYGASLLRRSPLSRTPSASFCVFSFLDRARRACLSTSSKYGKSVHYVNSGSRTIEAEHTRDVVDEFLNDTPKITAVLSIMLIDIFRVLPGQQLPKRPLALGTKRLHYILRNDHSSELCLIKGRFGEARVFL